MPRSKARRPRRRMRVVILMIVLIALVATTYLLWGGSRARQNPLVQQSTGPTIEQIRLLQQLVTMEVLVTDVLTTTTSGHTGSMEVILAVRAELRVGVDLARAELTDINQEARHAVLRLPEPQLQQVKIDHARSKVAAIRSNGLWVVLPGDSSIDARLIDAAYADAEKRFRATQLSIDQRGQAKEQAERVVRGFASSLGWTLEIQW